MVKPLTAFQFCCFASLFYEQQFGVQSQLCFVATLFTIASSVQFPILYFPYAVPLCYYAVQPCCYAVHLCCHTVLMCCSVAVQPRAVIAGRARTSCQTDLSDSCRHAVSCIRRTGDVSDWTVLVGKSSGNCPLTCVVYYCFEVESKGETAGEVILENLLVKVSLTQQIF